MSRALAIKDYYLTYVAPSLKDAFADKSDVRKACTAAIYLNHMLDYRAVELRCEKTKPVSDEILSDCLDSVIVRDVCDAIKHAEIKFKLSTRKLTNALQINAESNEGLFCAPFGEGGFEESNHVYVEFDNPDIPPRPLHEILSNVDQYWKSILGF